MPVWPPSLPDCTLSDDYQEQWIGGYIKTQMESGPDQVRRRFTRARMKMSGSILVDSDEYSLFFNWWDIDLAGGTLAFDKAHPINGRAMRVRFGQEPEVVPLGPAAFRIRMQLEEL